MKRIILGLIYFLVTCQATELNSTLMTLLNSYSPIFSLNHSFSWKTATLPNVTSGFSEIYDDTLQTKAIPWQHYDTNVLNEASPDTILPLSPYLGEGVDIYIVDQGIDTEHPEFSGRAKEIYNPYKAPRYCYNHGTPVASMAAGLVCGLAKSSRIFSVVIGLCPEATVKPKEHYEDDLEITRADAMNAFSAIIDHLRTQLDDDKKKAKTAGWSDAQIQAIQIRRSIINISMGHRSKNDSMTFSLLQMLFDMPNVVLTVAAGNDGVNANEFWPAGDERFFTVGSYTKARTLHTNSNWGKIVDAYGPGANVLAAQLDAPWGYTFITGTSFASPYIAGWMAAYWGLNPSMTSAQVQQAARETFLHIVDSSFSFISSGL